MLHQSIALFPIQNAVCLPGHKVSLHVFEPRYISLVRDCLVNKNWVGICASGSPKDAVFGAGPLKVIQKLSDGRFRVEVSISDRFRIIQRTQDLPYAVGLAEAVKVEPISPSLNICLRQELNAICHRLIKDQPSLLSSYIFTEESEKKSNSFFSDLCRALKWIVLPPEVLQRILESTSPGLQMDIFRAAIAPKKLFGSKLFGNEICSENAKVLLFEKKSKRVPDGLLSTQ